MDRRSALAATGVMLVAGCLDSPRTDGGDGDDSESGDGSDGGDDGSSDGGDEGGSNGGDDGGDGRVIEESPRVTTPPYPIEKPDRDTEDEWNPNYLGAAMPQEPSQPFEMLGGVAPADPIEGFDTTPTFRVRVAREAGALSSIVADPDAVSLDGRVLAVVEDGFGSGSVQHRWGRVEADDGELRLYGYRHEPLVQTDDVTARHSAVAIDAPGEVELVRVAMTTAPDRQVWFNSTEGVVQTPEE